MNFKSNIKEIKNKLLKLENKRTDTKGKLVDTFHKGVYVISQFEDQDSYKIGLARGNSGLYQRIKSYAIGYPYSDELFVHFMVICLSADDAEQFEKVVLGDKGLSKVEKNPSKGSLEWRINSTYHNINNSIKEACINNPNLWQHIIVFGKNGYRIIHNDLTKKYTRATFNLEKPLDTFTDKTNVYGNLEVIGQKKQPRSIERAIESEAIVPVKIDQPTGKFGAYSDDLVGKRILFKWDSVKPTDPRGWYEGHVLKRKTTLKERKNGLNYNVKYTKTKTKGVIVGTVATELTKENFGKKWMLISK
jgi:hypothetical protein